MPRTRKQGYGVVQEAVYDFLRAQPGVAARNAEIIQTLNINAHSVGGALVQLAKQKRIRQVTRGVYIFDTPETKPTIQASARPPMPEPNPVDEGRRSIIRPARRTEPIAPDTPTVFETVADTRDGRFILRDEHKVLWIASKL